MVKHMKEAKIACEVAMIAKTSSLGVCTRAKTMALKKAPVYRSTTIIIEDATTNKGDDGCYLQLRNRRLEWRAPPATKKAKKEKCACGEKDIDFQKENVGINFEEKPKAGGEIAYQKLGENGLPEKQDKGFEKEEKNMSDKKDEFDGKDEGSFGENDLSFENKESGRITRESTPCNFIVSSNVPDTPMSSNRATIKVQTVNNMENEEISSIIRLSEEEFEKFFGKADNSAVEEFIKKYNFDPVNEKPLEGRYEWVKVEP